jgi:hypothetical protein
MSTCPNCKKALSCGCQKRKASDGKVVCTNCLSKYEASLKTVSNVRTIPVVQKPNFTQEQLNNATNAWSNFVNKSNK